MDSAQINLRASKELETTNRQSPQPNSSGKNFRKIILFTCVFLLLTLASFAGGAVFLANQGDKTAVNHTAKVLDNPIVAKIAEKLPVPKITLIPITLAPTVTTEIIETPSNIVSDNSQNWLDYTNSELGFSLNYPPDLLVNETSHGLGVYEVSFNNNAGKSVLLILIYPKTIGKLIGQDFDLLYNLPNQSANLMKVGDAPPNQFTKIKNSIISGHKAFEFRSIQEDPKENVEAEVGVYIEINDSTLIVSTGESNKSILMQMLKSFKRS